LDAGERAGLLGGQDPKALTTETLAIPDDGQRSELEVRRLQEYFVLATEVGEDVDVFESLSDDQKHR
jgi:hypothetical protein